MNKDEFEIREKLQVTAHDAEVYKRSFKRIHEKRKNELFNELMDLFNSKADSDTIVRQVSRLAALDDLTREFNSISATEKRLTKKLEEKENVRKQEQRRDEFHQYNGG